MLGKRIFSAIIGIIIVILVIYSSSAVFFGFIALITLLGLRELRLILGLSMFDFFFLSAHGLIFLSFTYLNNEVPFILPFILIILLLVLIKAFIHGPGGINQLLGKYFLSFFYLSFLLSFAILIFQSEWETVSANRTLWLALITAWASDSGAYFSGMLLGRRPLAPQLSPKKSIAGAIGGFLLSGLAVVILAFIWKLPLTLSAAFLLGLIISFAAQCGDLLESALKRDAGIKDSGNIIPGHGGVLDRIDSLLLVLPVVYLCFKIII